MSSVSARAVFGMVVCDFSRSPSVFFFAAGGNALVPRTISPQQLMTSFFPSIHS